MRYVAKLKGQPHVLEDLAPCLQGDHAGLRKIEKEWVLESSAFDRCKTGQEVFQEADALVTQINAIFAIYLQLHDASTTKVGRFGVASELTSRLTRILRKALAN